MSEVKEVGIIGQMYEDRKSGKKGVLDSRDEKFKTLILVGEDGKSFNITYATFKSNWRKYFSNTDVANSEEVAQNISDVKLPEVVDETVPECCEEESVVIEEFVGSDDDAIAQLIAKSDGKLTIGVENSVVTLVKDDVVVCMIKQQQDGHYSVAMLPLIFVNADGKDAVVDVGSFTCKPSKLNLDVRFKVTGHNLGTILKVFGDEIIDANLYGYIVD